MNLQALRQSLPAELAQAVSGYVWRQNDIGFSSARVFRLVKENRPSLYLKIDSSALKHSLSQEKQKLGWLKKSRLPVAEVLLFAEDESAEYLLLSEIPGLPASDDLLKGDVPRVIEQLTSGLKMIHELPIKNCPFDARIDRKIETARERMVKGLVEEEDFDEIRRGRTAESLFRELSAAKPADEDLVFTHGDYCVPNVILDDGKLSGFVDWAGAGVADRYQDIALLTRSVGYNFGTQWEESVFEMYGVEPDWKKIHFYRLLDEFF